MSDNVVHLTPGKDTPHMHGTAYCMNCKHEWNAVSPAGAVEFECIKCGAMKGVYKYAALPENTPIFQCNCENLLFVVMEKGIMCANCGMPTDWDGIAGSF